MSNDDRLRKAAQEVVKCAVPVFSQHSGMVGIGSAILGNLKAALTPAAPQTPTEPSVPAAALIDGRYTWAQIKDAILKRWDGSEELEHWLKLLAYELGIDPEPESEVARQSATMDDEVVRWRKDILGDFRQVLSVVDLFEWACTDYAGWTAAGWTHRRPINAPSS